MYTILNKVSKFNKIFCNFLGNNLKEEYKQKFIEEINDTNLARVKFLSKIVVIWNTLMMLYLGYRSIYGLWIKNPFYEQLFYYHVIANILFILNFLIILKKDYIKKNFKIKNLDNFLVVLFVFFAVHWCAIATFFNNNQLLGYFGSLLLCSYAFVINPLESLIIFSSSYICILLGASYIENTPIVREQYNTTGMCLMILGLGISSSVYHFRVKDFLNKKIIEEKNYQLENIKKCLEDTVQKRTAELMSTNDKLIKEINTRHEIEILMMKSELEKQETEKKLFEAEESERIRGEFFANVSHELRTPLNIIFCTTQMLKFYSKKGFLEKKHEKVDSYFNIIMQNCYRLIRLINNIIDLTKIDVGSFNPNMKNYDIVQITKVIVESAFDYAKNLGIDLYFQSEIDSLKIACDPDKIERIILNLLSNAIKFTPKNGNITVKLFHNKTSVFISVKDTGIGIPQDKLDLIFERFQQVDKSLVKNKQGSGIGLSLVKSIVEMHNGQISVSSEIDKGSEFIIELPEVIYENINDESVYLNIDTNKTEIINVEFSDIYNEFVKTSEN